MERTMGAGDGDKYSPESCLFLLTQASERGKSWHLLPYVPTLALPFLSILMRTL